MKPRQRENLRKHKVGFDEGKTIFNDPFLLTFPDIDTSDAEERYVNIGLSIRDRVLVFDSYGKTG